MSYINLLGLTPKMRRTCGHVNDEIVRRGLRVEADGAVGHLDAGTVDGKSEFSPPSLAFNPDQFVDEFMAGEIAEREDLKSTYVRRALKIVIENNRQAAYREIVSRIEWQQNCEAPDWTKLTDQFDMDAFLCQKIFEQFIWICKKTMHGLEVGHHLMPVIVSLKQGTGKTFFVRRFLRPLGPLARTMSILDFIDRRVTDLDRYIAGVLDDMESIPKKNIETFKHTISEPILTRRKLNTSAMVAMPQRTNPIATSNRDVSHLIPDETGNRRVVQLPFRDNNRLLGGDPDNWDKVKQMDVFGFWRSVNPNSPPPIEPVYAALDAHQKTYIVKDDLDRWADNITANPASIANIYTQSGARVSDLHGHFLEMTKSTWSLAKFGAEMKARSSRPSFPFKEKYRKRDAFYCELKAGPPTNDGQPCPNMP